MEASLVDNIASHVYEDNHHLVEWLRSMRC